MPASDQQKSDLVWLSHIAEAARTAQTSAKAGHLIYIKVQ